MSTIVTAVETPVQPTNFCALHAAFLSANGSPNSPAKLKSNITAIYAADWSANNATNVSTIQFPEYATDIKPVHATFCTAKFKPIFAAISTAVIDAHETHIAANLLPYCATDSSTFVPASIASNLHTIGTTVVSTDRTSVHAAF